MYFDKYIIYIFYKFVSIFITCSMLFLFQGFVYLKLNYFMQRDFTMFHFTLRKKLYFNKMYNLNFTKLKKNRNKFIKKKIKLCFF